MNSDINILRSTIFSPLTTKGSELTFLEEDDNFINAYKDLLSLCVTNYVEDFDSRLYDNEYENYSKYGGRLWKFINATPGTGVTPGTDDLTWIEVFPTELAHKKYQAQDNIKAFAGGGQSGATLLLATYNIVDTVDTTLDSCKCDAALKHKVKEIFNNATNDLNLFPASGEKFIQDVTDLGADTPTVVAAGNSLKIVCYSDGIWRFF